jgi:hypothetical protein
MKTLLRNVGSIVVVVMLLAIIALGVVSGLAGCSSSQVGPSWEKSPDGSVESRNASPNRVSLSKDVGGGETWDSETSVPGKYIRMFDDNGAVVESLGPTSRVMLFPFFGKEAKIASDTDVTFSVEKATMPDGTKLEGFTFSTLASPVIKAQNEVWDRLAAIVVNRDTMAAEVLLKEAETNAEIAKTLGSAGIELLTKVITGGI